MLHSPRRVFRCPLVESSGSDRMSVARRYYKCFDGIIYPGAIGTSLSIVRRLIEHERSINLHPRVYIDASTTSSLVS